MIAIQRAAVLFMDLLTFVVGCALLHMVNGKTELFVEEYEEWAVAFDTGFVAVCGQLRATMTQSLFDTTCLAVAVSCLWRRCGARSHPWSE